MIEVMAVAMLLVPIALFMLDLLVIVAANNINDTAAKNAARAAANQSDQGAAQLAAQKALETVQTSGLISKLQLDGNVQYSASKEDVQVQTRMEVSLPVPFPGYDKIEFVAKAVEPILG